MIRAVIYARYSSHNQREESIEGQLRICNRYAVEHDIFVVREYTDSALSGRTDQRPSFQRMIEDSAKKEFELVLVYAHDRFARNRYDAATYKTRLKKNGVRLLSVTMPLDDSPESGLVESVFEGFAQYYSENLARATKRGMEENALKCRSNGPQPLGYKSDNGQIVVDPVGAQAVRMIFTLYCDGYGKQEICRTLKNKGYKTAKGADFTVNSLTCILGNKRYTGTYSFGNYHTEDGIPVIIEQSLWDSAQAETKRRKASRGRYKAMEEYLLAGKAFCGECGKPLVGESGKGSKGTVYRYYKCAGRKKNPKACTKATIKKDVLEGAVIRYVCEEVLTDDFIDQIATECYRQLDEESQDKSLLLQLQSDHKDVSKKIENILTAIEAGIFTPKTKERLLDLETQQAALEDKIVIEKLKKPEFTKDHIVFWLLQFRSGTITDVDYQRSIINSLINSVFVYDDKEGNDNMKIVIALTLKNVPAKVLTRSDVNSMVTQTTQNPNFLVVKKYFVLVRFNLKY